jgi:hypothetical protein
VITNDEALSCKIKVPLLLFAPPTNARPDQIQPAFGATTTRYRSEKSLIPKREYASGRIDRINSDAGKPRCALQAKGSAQLDAQPQPP